MSEPCKGPPGWVHLGEIAEADGSVYCLWYNPTTRTWTFRLKKC